MGTPNILHMIYPTKHVSPFDVNMAADAGYNVIIPYEEVTELWEVTALTQDAMFSRSPEDCKRTGGFFGGKNAILALDMMDKAKDAMFAPFQYSLFADPAGSFTTAAAMVACVRKLLMENGHPEGLKGMNTVIYGGTGVVAFAAGVIASLDGAHPYLVGYDGTTRVEKIATSANERFGTNIGFADGSSEQQNADLAKTADVIFAAGPAGRQILSTDHLRAASQLKAAADVNAVAPAGIQGIELHDNGKPIPGCSGLGIGPLTIGDIKYKTQSILFKQMIDTDEPLFLDFRQAYEAAKGFVG